MTKDQYRKALEALGLTQETAAELLGYSVRSSHGYANGQPVPLLVSTVLRALVAGKIAPSDVK